MRVNTRPVVNVMTANRLSRCFQERLDRLRNNSRSVKERFALGALAFDPAFDVVSDVERFRLPANTHLGVIGFTRTCGHHLASHPGAVAMHQGTQPAHPRPKPM